MKNPGTLSRVFCWSDSEIYSPFWAGGCPSRRKTQNHSTDAATQQQSEPLARNCTSPILRACCSGSFGESGTRTAASASMKTHTTSIQKQVCHTHLNFSFMSPPYSLFSRVLFASHTPLLRPPVCVRPFVSDEVRFLEHRDQCKTAVSPGTFSSTPQ